MKNKSKMLLPQGGGGAGRTQTSWIYSVLVLYLFGMFKLGYGSMVFFLYFKFIDKPYSGEGGVTYI